MKDLVDNISTGIHQGIYNLRGRLSPHSPHGYAPPSMVPVGHRRHTCDGCNQRPILGPRFHCNEVVDYDLCEGCHTASSVSAPQAGAKALTYQRIEGAPLRGRGWSGRRGRGGWNGHGNGGPHGHGGPHGGHGQHGPTPHHHHAFPHHARGDPMKKLVEEAIRRSLEDQKSKVLRDVKAGTPLRRASKERSPPSPKALAVPPVAVPPSPPSPRSSTPDAFEWTSVEVDAAVILPPVAVLDPAPGAGGPDPITKQIEGDAVLARACELMGSALFSSARLDEDEEEDSDSKPASNPVQRAAADNATVHNAALQAAYSTQLSQLKSLGLVSRFGLPACLSILERLSAANVGSDEGKVTVQQVIHELLKVEG